MVHQSRKNRSESATEPSSSVNLECNTSSNSPDFKHHFRVVEILHTSFSASCTASGCLASLANSSFMDEDILGFQHRFNHRLHLFGIVLVR